MAKTATKTQTTARHLTSGIVYKVWIEIERYDIDREQGETIDLLNVSCSGTFATVDDARDHAMKLHDASAAMPNAPTVTHD